MTKVSKRWGLKPNDIVAICDDYQIPRPPNGHWSQVKWGKAVPRPELPPSDGNDVIEVNRFRKQIRANSSSTNVSLTSADPDTTSLRPTMAGPKDEPVGIVKVLARLSTSPHPIVKKLKAEPDPQHRLTSYSNWQPESSEMAISVSKTQKDRALRILDAIFKAWEAQGFSTRLVDGALIDGADAVTFSLTEQYRRVDMRKPGEGWAPKKRVETGQLTLFVTSQHFANLRTKWCDGKVQKIEDLLNSFLQTIPAYMSSMRQDRIDRECKARQQVKVKNLQTVRERLADVERKKIKELCQATSDWAQAKQIRDYLAALVAWKDSGQARPRSQEAFESWLEWAHWYADELCPLTFSRPGPGKSAQLQNTLLADLDITSKTRNNLESVTVLDTDQLYQLSKSQLVTMVSNTHWLFFDEMFLVMQGLGYDMSNKDWKKQL